MEPYLSEQVPQKTVYELEQEQVNFVLKEEREDDEQLYRHTYYEEQMLMQAVREGKAKDALRLVLDMDRDSGRLALHDEIRHWKNLAIVGISLCARAAIDGGVSPQTAYRASGYYIQKCEEQRDIAGILSLRNQAIEDLTQRVSAKLNGRGTSSYVSRTKDYVRKHYRGKIRLNPIAESLGINPNYLSRLFRQETGEHLFDFVNRVRVERAASLLIYSDMKLNQIAEYVHFPTQSYFGKMFKRFKGVTPRVFRERNRSKEYLS